MCSRSFIWQNARIRELGCSFHNFFYVYQKVLIQKFMTLACALWLLAHTVKLARAKLPANAGNFTCSSHVKRPHTQFICVTCSLPVKTGKFTCVETASTSCKKHANCLQAHVNLPEYHGHFTSNFKWGTHASFLRLACKIACFCRQNTCNLQAKTLK